ALPVYVSFAPAFLPAASDSGWRLRPARTVLTNRSYLHSATDAPTGDLGLVLLAEPVATVPPAQLPPEGLLDRLDAFSADATVEYPWQPLITVGYGISMSNHPESARASSFGLPASPPSTRRWRAPYAALPFDRVFPDSLHIRRADGAATRYRASGPLSDGSGATPNDSTGSACAGGSGGPVLLGNTSTIVAVTSFGPERYATCTGGDSAYRLDTPAARAFLEGFVPLP
ncbi:MAG TPA: hypothetical protein VGW38_29630, partial [Chloroflexota bacterium]|nr:hypothetical protein [Chloroflexota bacterium]